MHESLRALFGTLHRDDIEYCLLRDGDHLDELTSGSEIDILIRNRDLRRLENALGDLAFVRLPARGHAPHHFYVTYDPASESWFKLDLTTDVMFGRPVAALKTGLGAQALATRRREGAVFVPAPECELVLLLLHCVLDKERVTDARAGRLQTLRGRIRDERLLSRLLTAYWLPHMKWPEIARCIEAADWPRLLAAGSTVAARLMKRDPMGTWARHARGRIARKAGHLMRTRHPPTPMVAFLGPDGAGKSTLIADIRSTFYFPACAVYMGLYADAGERSRRLLPGVSLAARVATAWLRYLTARWHRMQGRLVLFDRYTYDALLPSSPAVGLSRARRWILANACPGPDLAVVLDASGDLLYRRKHEHSAAWLEERRQGYLSLRTVIPRLAVVDATQGQDEVRRIVVGLIWQLYRQRNPLGTLEAARSVQASSPEPCPPSSLHGPPKP